jgi:hypothetical protein
MVLVWAHAGYRTCEPKMPVCVPAAFLRASLPPCLPANLVVVCCLSARGRISGRWAGGLAGGQARGRAGVGRGRGRAGRGDGNQAGGRAGMFLYECGCVCRRKGPLASSYVGVRTDPRAVKRVDAVGSIRGRCM